MAMTTNTTAAFNTLAHLTNISPMQLINTTNILLLVLAFMVFLFLGIALKHALKAAIAFVIVLVLLFVAAGVSTSFGSVSAQWYAFLVPLTGALEAIFLESGVYSVVVCILGFATGFYFVHS